MKALTKVVMKVFLPNNKFSRTVVHTAPRGQRFTGDSVQHMLDTMVSRMEEANPGTKYRCVPVRGQQFNIVCIERPHAQPQSA